MFVFFLLASASAAAWLGFYVFRPLATAPGADVELAITAPETATVTEPFTYRIVIANRSSEDIHDIGLRLNYPDGFRWASATLTPENAARNTWTVPLVRSGEARELVVTGLLLGEAGSLRTIFGVATYRLPNFRSELEATASAAIKLVDAPVRLAWSGSASSTPGEQASYRLTYEHLGSVELPALTVRLEVSSNFTVTATEPAVAIDALRWELENLLPKATGTITITGTWQAAASGGEPIKAVLEGRSDTGAPYVVGTAVLVTQLLTGDVGLTLTVNGSEFPGAVNLGATVAYVLQYENTSDHTIEDIEAQVRYETALVDWGSEAIEDGGRVDGSTVTWSSATTPALIRLLPKASGGLRWRIPLIQPPSPAGSVLAVTAVPTVRYRRLDGEPVDRTVEGVPVTVTVNGDARLVVEVRYFDDDNRTVGSGPLPPKVGTPTTLFVRWRIENAQHELSDVRVAAALPPGVQALNGSGATEIGQLAIDGANGPTWAIDRLAAGLQPEASFRITLTPAVADLGKVVVLTGRTTMTATDAFTKGAVTTSGNVVTSNLESDPTARGQGVVGR